jgi:phosphoserine aminotransferase
MKRVLNFSPGPSALPLEVLEQAQKDLVCYKDTGMSVMEMSHRSPMFEEILQNAKASLKRLMNIPDDYHILFLQGGASTQFSACALNLMQNRKACYADTGSFANKAMKEAMRYGQVLELVSSKDNNYAFIPQIAEVPQDAAYLHITTNNTIYGTQYNTLPETGEVPLVADMSSNILGKYYDTSKFAMIYAGAQKNMGPAGLTLVVIKDELLGHAMDITPTMLDYKTMADKDSMYNTPPTWAIYIASLVFEWVERQGGVQEMEKVNVQKANLIYDIIDNYGVFSGVARKDSRSIMNITMRLPSDELTAKFVEEAKKAGLVNVKGHRSVGGIRTSIYNAMTLKGVEKLANFMTDFARKNG